MEAVISGSTSHGPSSRATRQRLGATKRLLRAARRWLERVVVEYSRPALLLKGGPRAIRRL